MSTRSLPTPPPEGPVETPVEPPAETDPTTPPATGAEEAAAPTNPPPAQPEPQPTQIHTIYKEIFTLIANKAIDKDWSGLTMLAELYDLRVCPGHQCSQSRTS